MTRALVKKLSQGYTAETAWRSSEPTGRGSRRATPHAVGGNHSILRKIESGQIKVSQPGDKYEREADRIAEQVLRVPDLYTTGVEGGRPLIKRVQPVVAAPQLKLFPTNPTATESDRKHAIGSSYDGGHPLPESVRSFFEPRFGHDFSRVRVHMDTRASEMAKHINARAFTYGLDIAFRAGEYRPDTQEGRWMLSHELTHVVQQGGTNPPVVQRQPSVFHFNNCTSNQNDVIDWTIRQSFLMVRHAINTLITVIGLILTRIEDQELSSGVFGVVNAAGHEFGSGDTSTLSDVRDNYIEIRDKYKQGLNINCHNDPSKNQVAEASTPGNDIWMGPKFFNDETNDLVSRPRIFIHEVAHNTGLEHAFPGMAIVAGQNGPAGAAEVAHGADGYALFAYRVFTGRYRGEIERNDAI